MLIWPIFAVFQNVSIRYVRMNLPEHFQSVSALKTQRNKQIELCTQFIMVQHKNIRYQRMTYTIKVNKKRNEKKLPQFFNAHSLSSDTKLSFIRAFRYSFQTSLCFFSLGLFFSTCLVCLKA